MSWYSLPPSAPQWYMLIPVVALISTIGLILLFFGVRKHTNIIVVGCTDSNAQNYNADATANDGSCTFDDTNLDALKGQDGPQGFFGPEGDKGPMGDPDTLVIDSNFGEEITLTTINYPDDGAFDVAQYTDGTETTSARMFRLGVSGNATFQDNASNDDKGGELFCSNLEVNGDATIQRNMFVNGTLYLQSTEELTNIEADTNSSPAIRAHLFLENDSSEGRSGWWIGTQNENANTGEDGDLDLYFVTQTRGIKERVAWIADLANDNVDQGNAGNPGENDMLNRNRTEEALTSGVNKHFHALDFTGQHRCLMDGRYDESMLGLIVRSTGNFVNLNNTLYPQIQRIASCCRDQLGSSRQASLRHNLRRGGPGTIPCSKCR